MDKNKIDFELIKYRLLIYHLLHRDCEGIAQGKYDYEIPKIKKWLNDLESITFTGLLYPEIYEDKNGR